MSISSQRKQEAQKQDLTLHLLPSIWHTEHLFSEPDQLSCYRIFGHSSVFGISLSSQWPDLHCITSKLFVPAFDQALISPAFPILWRQVSLGNSCPTITTKDVLPLPYLFQRNLSFYYPFAITLQVVSECSNWVKPHQPCESRAHVKACYAGNAKAAWHCSRTGFHFDWSAISAK